MNFLTAGGYWGIFLLMVLENIIPPVPSEAIMGVAGIAAARGQMDFTLLVLVGTLGCVVGNLFWFEIGKRVGYERLKPFVDRHERWLTFGWAEIERLERFFERHGGKTVFTFRFLPFGRTMISLPAGLLGMSTVRFILYTAGGSAVWNTILVGFGYWLGTSFTTIDHYVSPVIVALVVVGIAWYAWRVVTWKSHKRD